jgi:S-adenosylmethionine synthetase
MVTPTTLLLSLQHDREVSLEELRRSLLPLLPTHFDKILINPKGTFIEGGPSVDTGLTGRKIVYDSYGSQVPIGGGCFSGKDPSKIDRSGAYYARYLAKKILKEHIVDSALVQLSFGIGFEKPLSVTIKTTPPIPIDSAPYSIELEEMIELLHLRAPIYLPTAYGGHFGRLEFPWEQL